MIALYLSEQNLYPPYLTSLHLTGASCDTSGNVNEGGSDREVYEEMKRLYRLLGATVIQVIKLFQ